ncbi:MAG: stage III sporulation AC/AD family protein [Cellulosilyticum sp.]|nr:stage III sporulation protein AC [Cellulosilyticum sp.]MBQ1274526.1 stage III sporulation AC/AD family protein [Cellulosilyticum sp.]MEE1072605.1 stage III sporulation AC/AD family protein [Cellulosilyticum sp.]
MFDFSVIFKLAGLGICVAILNMLLDSVGAKEWKFPISVVGVIMGLLLILNYVRQLFEVVQTFSM